MLSVVIPTLWKCDRLEVTLKELSECEIVNDIVLIDNTSNSVPLRINKVHHVLEGRNTFVTAAWNKGVRLAKCDKLLILNDDTWFDWSVFEQIMDRITPSVGMIGISQGNYWASGENIIQLVSIEERPTAFACAFFIHRDSWISLPEEMRIWYQDDWLFMMNRKAGRHNYGIVNLKTEGCVGLTTEELRQDEVIQQIIDQDRSVFVEYERLLDQESESQD